jgi:putative Ca2+/H+ antiporter (TMEM165/GDT1 family)
MDWKLVSATFVSVFLAELGDKTQLATLSFAADAKDRWAVLLGSAGALVCTSVIAVLAGGAVARLVPPYVLQRAAGVLFMVLGAWTLWGAAAPR